MAHHDGRADQAEDPPGETRPQPDAVPVVAEPPVEGQQGHERHEPEHRPDRNDAARVDLHRRRRPEVGHAADRSAMTAVVPRYEVRCVDLGPGPSPEELVRRAAGRPGLVCLRGAWAGGTPLLAAHPVRVLPSDADPIAALAEQPVVTDGHEDAVGGGWFGRLAFDGPSQLAFYDCVLRLMDGRWRFEALWSAGRDAALG